MKLIKIALLLALQLPLFCEIHLVGVVKPKHDIKLSFSVDGIVKKKHVKEGDVVKKGTRLISLDDELQNFETKRREYIWKNNERSKTKRQEIDILKEIYVSTKELYESSGGVSKEGLLSLQLRYIASSGELNFLQESKKQEKVEYDIAKTLLSKYVLKSPVSGVITEIKSDIGEFAKGSEPIIRIVDSSTCNVELNVESGIVPILRKNKKVTITNNKESVEGKIIYISPVADKTSGLFFVKAQFQNKKAKILPGLTADVIINKTGN